MKAVIVQKSPNDNGAVEAAISEVVKPIIKKDEALIRVLRAGICNTDIEILQGYSGFLGILGHEFVGVVHDINTDNSFGIKKEQRVVGDINLPCGTCETCLEQSVASRNHCPNRSVLGIRKKDGTYAEYMSLPIKNLHAVPDDVTDQQACFTEPLAAACRILEQGILRPGYRVAVIGDGKMGLLITEVLASNSYCKELVLFGHHMEKMELVPDSVTKVILEEKALSNIYIDSFDVTVEVSGKPDGINMAMLITKALGTVILKTTCAHGNTQFNPAAIVIKELNIIGSRCGPMDVALNMLAEKQIDVDKYVSRVYPLQQAVDAIQFAQENGVIKVHISMV